MPMRQDKSGYARIAQAEEDEEDEGAALDPYNDTENAPITTEPIQAGRRHRPGMPSHASASGHNFGRRRRTSSGADLKAINARFEKWADEIKDTFKIRKIRGKTADEERLEIHHSVFQAPDWIRPLTDSSAQPTSGDKALSQIEFDDIVESVRVAIELGTHPTLISQGSSGSYFARNTRGKIVGVFKPKDEEPYASRNPKWTKWIHRNLFPFFFGRACLIPNLSYVSEAAAHVLDSRLQTNLVPHTAVVSLSSKSFYYDIWERKAYYRGKKPLPEKPGSLQVFLKGYKDANIFLKEHPWPENAGAGGTRRTLSGRRSWLGDRQSRPKTAPETLSQSLSPTPQATSPLPPEFWTSELQESLRQQLERLVILDYIMRNTDRGLDNWMIKVDAQTQTATIVARPPSEIGQPDGTVQDAHGVSLGAIDNSLSWPWKHPDAWRSYPFGWLFLPVSLIGRPFSQATRLHFLPLLTSTHWWSETLIALRRCFEQDADFSERMFARQMSVMKGQAWNVVETLKTDDHGPLELTRRARVCVWDDVVKIPVATAPTSSGQMRSRSPRPTQDLESHEHEEMDISSALPANSRSRTRILSYADSISDRAVSPNRFNVSRQHSNGEIRLSDDHDRMSPSSLNNFKTDKDHASSIGSQGTSGKRKSRLSLDEARKLFDNLGPRGHRRRFSAGTTRLRNHSMSIGLDDDEGDLGYAAAEDQDGNYRKVIVERLETVKGKTPTFTWC